MKAKILLQTINNGYTEIADIDTEDFPLEAIKVIAHVLADNKHKYAPGNWRTLSKDIHLDHARNHFLLIAYYDLLKHHDNGEPHLHHALTRLAMAVEVEGG